MQVNFAFSFRKMALFAIYVFLLSPLFVSAQTTQGTDFWVTFMRADDDNPTELSLTISSKTACTVTINNPYTGWSQQVSMGNNDLQEVVIAKTDCYVGTNEAEIVTNRAIHVISTEDISVFAGNWRSKSFDVTNVLPTVALKDEYIVQTYTPSDHEDNNQGSHFAIVAIEDNTIVDYVPTAATTGNPSGGAGGGTGSGGEWGAPARMAAALDTVRTDTLMAGQVWYVWSGQRNGLTADLSGTYVKARNGKSIAVFNGNPHTNIPFEIRDRDHLFSQAMPTAYWGTRFTVTASETRKKDKIRVLAINDGTTVTINGDSVYTFDFATNPRRFYEFELGDASVAGDGTPVISGTSCFVETSCPCAVHLFMVSNRYDYPVSPYCDGDPAMVWINPIEQVIDEITFGTYQDYNHYVNVVTTASNVSSMQLDGTSISANFQTLLGNSNYSFARMSIPSGTHTLKGDAGFIAHVYGYGEKESYGYSAGGATKPLEQSITINGDVYSASSENVLCDNDGIIDFTCEPNYEVENITWCFGDGSPLESGRELTTISHEYANPGIYYAYVLVSRLSSNLCQGQLAQDSIPIKVNIEQLHVSLDSVSEFICAKTGTFNIYYTNETGGAISAAAIEFDDAAKAQGFSNTNLAVTPAFFEVQIPEVVEPAQTYTAQLVVTGDCADEILSVSFMVNYAADSVLAQRWNDVLAVKNLASITGHYDFRSFQWYKNGSAIPAEQGGNLSYIYLNSDVWDSTDTYHVELVNAAGLKLCSCPTELQDKSNDTNFEFETAIDVKETTVQASAAIRVSVTENGFARFWNVMGHLVSTTPLTQTENKVQAPDRAGIYLLEIELNTGDRKTEKITVTK